MRWAWFVLNRSMGATEDQEPARPLYDVSRIHLEAMTTEIGVWQHARGSDPDPRFGYCTDDVARALVVHVLQSRELGWRAVDESAAGCVRFLTAAFDRVTGRFLNFRDADGEWLDAEPSEDCHARALHSLAMLMAQIPGTELADRARDLFLLSLPAALTFRAIRPISAALLATDIVIEAGVAPSAAPVFDKLASRLIDDCDQLDGDWPWPEPVLTYENPIVPRALLAAGARTGRQAVVETACFVLDWLIEVQISESGNFSPIGNSEWWWPGKTRSRFDQQPIEAATMVLAATDAFHATGYDRYERAAEAAYAWFLGDNDVGVPLADPASGGCFDGLNPRGASINQGAESTLMWLTALETMRELRHSSESGGWRERRAKRQPTRSLATAPLRHPE